MRIASSGGTASARAVQSSQLKIATITELIAATTSNLTAREVIQHAAAGMLLCSFEVHQASCTSSQWTWYITGVKEVLGSSCLKYYSHDSDLDVLRDWVYYHDVMSRFVLRHWRGETLATVPNMSEDESLIMPPSMRVLDKYQITGIALQCPDPSSAGILELLAELSETVIAQRRDPASLQQIEGHMEYLRILEWRIRNVAIEIKPSSGGEDTVVPELFKFATLVYLNRISDDLLDQASSIKVIITDAFAMFSKLRSCERQYPLFILGCEARTDEQRLTILDLISRTEKQSSSRSLVHVKLLLQAVWAQDDLSDTELDYWDKMSSIISCCTIVPSLV
ncbi:hypothetical protein MMC25_007938 [Agyrium rufum]|nr:hypothetical protein [Agyrium rufum]